MDGKKGWTTELIFLGPNKDVTFFITPSLFIILQKTIFCSNTIGLLSFIFGNKNILEKNIELTKRDLYILYLYYCC